MAKCRRGKSRDVGVHITVCCAACGKPIVFSDRFGMYCEDKCGRVESVLVGRSVDTILWFLDGLFPG